MPYQLEDISFSYGEKAVLRNLSIAFPQTGLVAVTGPSGCGKTTLLRLLCGLEKPSAGRILGFPDVTVAQAFQAPRLMPWLSAVDNVATVVPRGSRAVRRKTAQTWLERFFAAGFSASYPAALSGGEQQRVSLARAFAPGSAVVLLDEPTASLDPALREQVFSAICACAADCLCVVATHRAEEAESAKLHIQL